MDKTIKYGFILLFLTIGMFWFAPDVYATIESGKSIYFETGDYDYQGNTTFSGTGYLPEPGSIYAASLKLNNGGSRPSSYLCIYGVSEGANKQALIQYDNKKQFTHNGWDSFEQNNYYLVTGTLNNVISGINYYEYRGVVTMDSQRACFTYYYYTYTLTPSEYSYSIVKDPNDEEKMYIKIDWHMIDEPENLQYQVHNKTTNQYSSWILGNRGTYSWIDYNVNVGTQYEYEITFRQSYNEEGYWPPQLGYIYKTVTIGSYTINPVIESLKEIKDIITHEEYGNEALGDKITNINNKMESMSNPIIIKVQTANGATAVKLSKSNQSPSIIVTASGADKFGLSLNGVDWIDDYDIITGGSIGVVSGPNNIRVRVYDGSVPADKRKYGYGNILIFGI